MRNPLRIEGPDPPETTCADIETWLVAAFMVLPGTPIFSVRDRDERVLNPHVAPDTFDWVAFSAKVLGRDSRPRLYLLTWARAEARRRAIARNLPNPPAGGSVADFCREYGIQRRTFDRTRARACGLVASAWNARRRGP